MAAGSLNILSTVALDTLVTNMQAVKTDLDLQASAISALQGQIALALQGSTVDNFIGKFDGWIATLGMIINDIDSAYTALSNLSAAVDSNTTTLAGL